MNAKDQASELPIEALKAIAHPLRFAIMACVASGERNVSEIEDLTGIGQPTLSQQLSVLRQAGLVNHRREAKLVFYRVDRDAMKQVCTSFQKLCPPDLRTSMLSAAPEPETAKEKSIRRKGGAAVFARLG